MGFLSLSPPATPPLAISPTATGQPLFLSDVQNQRWLQSIMMELLVVEDQMGIMRIMADSYVEEHLTGVSRTNPASMSARP